MSETKRTMSEDDWKRLEAAAPDLLEALQEAMRWIGRLTDWAGAGDPDVEKWRAALAKAKGGQVMSEQIETHEYQHFRIAIEDHAEEGPLLWIKDTLDDAYLSFTRDEMRGILPFLIEWLAKGGE